MISRIQRLLLVLFVVIAVDQALKFWVYSSLPSMRWHNFSYPFGGIGVFQDFLGGIDFAIVNQANKGAAWGLFSDWPHSLLVARALVTAVLLLWFLRTKREKALFPLALIIAGALSNIGDFFFYGHVVDMFSFRFWGWDYPVFNIADSSIFCGVALFLLRRP